MSNIAEAYLIQILKENVEQTKLLSRLVELVEAESRSIENLSAAQVGLIEGLEEQAAETD